MAEITHNRVSGVYCDDGDASWDSITEFLEQPGCSQLLI